MMAKKYIQKTLSVGLSLVLCASLVAPALAASFQDLQDAVNNVDGTQIEGTDRYGYGSQLKDSSKYEIEAWNDEDGTRNVQLNADVTRTGDEGHVGVGTNDYNRGDTLNLDLNGHTVDAKGVDAAIKAESGTVTIQDTNQEKKGTITGGTDAGVIVAKKADVTLKDVTVDGDKAGVWVSGAEGAVFTNESGTITGTDTGVRVDGKGASANLNGGVVENGLTVGEEAEVVNLNGGNLSGGITEPGNKVVIKDGHTIEDGALVHHWAAWETTSEAQIGIAGVREHHCLAEGCGESQTEEIPARPAPSVAPLPTNPALIVSDEPVIEIDEPAVPLAEGPVTGGEFIDYLWRHEDEPEAESEPEAAVDHEYAEAITWALSIGIIPDEGFDPDELVTVSFVREILTNFALYSDMAMPELTTLEGDEDEAVLNCGEVLAEFFGETEAEAEAE